MTNPICIISDHDRVETIDGKRVRQFLADNMSFLVYDITGIEATRNCKFITKINQRAIRLPAGFRLVRIHGVECHPPEEITEELAKERNIEIFNGLP